MRRNLGSGSDTVLPAAPTGGPGPVPRLRTGPIQQGKKKSPNQEGLGLRDWWNRGESNPRPQAITGRFYMRSCLI